MDFATQMQVVRLSAIAAHEQAVIVLVGNRDEMFRGYGGGEAAQWCVLRIRGTTARCVHRSSQPLGCVHLTPGGRIYFGGSNAGLHVWDPVTSAVQAFDVPAGDLVAVGEREVYCCAPNDHSPLVHRWRDGVVTELPALPEECRVVRGLDPRHLLAGGYGFSARWDGERWHPVPGAEEATIDRLFIVDRERAYACSTETAEVFALIDERWRPIEVALEEPKAIAIHESELWVAGDDGLVCGDRLVDEVQDYHFITVAEGRVVAAHLESVVVVEDGVAESCHTLSMAEELFDRGDLPELTD